MAEKKTVRKKRVKKNKNNDKNTYTQIETKDEIDMNVTLKDLINRLNINEKFLKEHPENKELLERKNAEIKELIIQCILQNKDNSLLNDIVLK